LSFWRTWVYNEPSEDEPSEDAFYTWFLKGSKDDGQPHFSHNASDNHTRLLNLEDQIIRLRVEFVDCFVSFGRGPNQAPLCPTASKPRDSTSTKADKADKR
jgi:hypothetical protein